MTETVGKKKMHYAWVVLICCCAMTASTGILLQTGGQWFPPLTGAPGYDGGLNLSVTEIYLYLIICSFCMAPTAPFVGRFLPKVNARLLLSGAAILCILAVAAMSFYSAGWQWWISGAILGIAGSFIFVIPSPIILGNWFVKKQGFAIGLAMSFSGISAAIFNPVAQILIANLGWRLSYVVVAAIAAIIVLPCTLILVRFKPEDKGLKAYGAEEVNEADAAAATEATEGGVALKVATKSVPFIILFLVCGLMSVATGYTTVLPQYVTTPEVNMPVIAGLIATMCMGGSFVGMLGLGAISGKLGGMKTGVLGSILVLIGLLGLLLLNQIMVVVLAAGLLYGISLSLVQVVTPIVAREAFGGKNFAQIYSNLMIAVTLIGAIGALVNSIIIDTPGLGFSAAFLIGIVAMVLIILGIIVSVPMAKRLPRES